MPKPTSLFLVFFLAVVALLGLGMSVSSPLLGGLLPRRLFDRMAARAFPRAGVCLRPLPPNRKLALVSHPAVAADVDQPLDVHGDLFAQVALDLLPLFDDLTDGVDLFLRQGFDLLVPVDSGFLEDFVRF